MNDKYEKLFKLLAAVRPERQTRNGQLAEQENLLKKYNKNPSDFAREIQMTQQQISHLKNDANARNNQLRAEIMDLSRGIADELAAKANTSLDLTDVKFINALQLANLVNLDYRQATSLAEQFRGNQAAIRLLKSKFDERKITSGIDELMYDPAKVMDTIESHVINITGLNKPAEGLMRYIGKLAKYEGIDLPEVGGDDIWDGARAGAGLEPAVAPGAKVQ